jgi:hypothetical protein
MTAPMSAQANAYAGIAPALWRPDPEDECLQAPSGWRIAEPVSEIPWMNSMVARGPARLPVNLA